MLEKIVGDVYLHVRNTIINLAVLNVIIIITKLSIWNNNIQRSTIFICNQNKTKNTAIASYKISSFVLLLLLFLVMVVTTFEVPD